jgi:hypothetical protein
MSESGLIVRVASLFGLLAISFIVVVLNAMVLILVRHVVQTFGSGLKEAYTEAQYRFSRYTSTFYEFLWWKFPDLRAPPVTTVMRS